MASRKPKIFDEYSPLWKTVQHEEYVTEDTAIEGGTTGEINEEKFCIDFESIQSEDSGLGDVSGGASLDVSLYRSQDQHVLEIPELLEHILSFLSIPELLRVQTVCSLWKAIIEESPGLQHLLWMKEGSRYEKTVNIRPTPVPGATYRRQEDYRELNQTVQVNPLVVKVFEIGCFALRCLLCGQLAHNIPHGCLSRLLDCRRHVVNVANENFLSRAFRRALPSKVPIYLRRGKNYSWRKMLLTRPACYRLGPLAVVSSHQSVELRDCEIGLSDAATGVTLGDLADALEMVSQNKEKLFHFGDSEISWSWARDRHLGWAIMGWNYWNGWEMPSENIRGLI